MHLPLLLLSIFLLLLHVDGHVVKLLTVLIILLLGLSLSCFIILHLLLELLFDHSCLVLSLLNEMLNSLRVLIGTEVTKGVLLSGAIHKLHTRGVALVQTGFLLEASFVKLNLSV